MAILFFNLQVLETGTACDPVYLVTALYKLHKGIKYAKNTFETYKPLKGLTAGSSFILNPDALFNDRTTDPIYKAQYIRLAGRRDYTLYKVYGIRSLDLTMYPDLDIQNLRSNPLLTISNTQISFKYEE